MSMFWVTFWRPFVALAIAALITAPIRRLVQRRMREGKLKNVLLIDMERQPRLYAYWWVGIVVVFYGGLALLVGRW